MDSDYGDKIRIFAFPCNHQFGKQEPGTPEEIQAFVDERGVKFPLFEKVAVKGDDMHPIYAYLRDNDDTGKTKITWNFGKFLVRADGTVDGYYDPRTDPDELRARIDELVAE